MSNINDFFTNANKVSISDVDFEQTHNYLTAIKAFARTTYKSVYVIDYEKKGFEYVSDNPLFLCGYTPEQIKQMGYAFYFKHVTPSDIDLLLRINTVGFEFYDKLPVEEKLKYILSYDFKLVNQDDKAILINQKITPLFLTKGNKVWKALCIVSISNAQESGNIKIYKRGDSKVFKYDLEGGFWSTQDGIKLSKREKEILQHAARGLKINEIADAIFVSPDTIKFHRRKLFDKLEVSNMTEAISFVTNNKLI